MYIVECTETIKVPRNGPSPPNKPHMNHINVNCPHCRKYDDYDDINKSSPLVHNYPKSRIPMKPVLLETPNKV